MIQSIHKNTSKSHKWRQKSVKIMFHSIHKNTSKSLKIIPIARVLLALPMRKKMHYLAEVSEDCCTFRRTSGKESRGRSPRQRPRNSRHHPPSATGPRCYHRPDRRTDCPHFLPCARKQTETLSNRPLNVNCIDCLLGWVFNRKRRLGKVYVRELVS